MSALARTMSDFTRVLANVGTPIDGLYVTGCMRFKDGEMRRVVLHPAGDFYATDNDIESLKDGMTPDDLGLEPCEEDGDE